MPSVIQDRHGIALEQAVQRMVLTIDELRGKQTILGTVVEPEYPALSTGAVFTSGRGPTTWVASAEHLFGGSRYMTPDERAEFDAINRSMTKPLSKPLKKRTR